MAGSSRWALSRRDLLATGLAAAALPLLPGEASSEDRRRPKVAAVFTAMAHRFHAHVILENFLEPASMPTSFP
jgi:hypothetical protein